MADREWPPDDSPFGKAGSFASGRLGNGVLLVSVSMTGGFCVAGATSRKAAE